MPCLTLDDIEDDNDDDDVFTSTRVREENTYERANSRRHTRMHTCARSKQSRETEREREREREREAYPPLLTICLKTAPPQVTTMAYITPGRDLILHGPCACYKTVHN